MKYDETGRRRDDDEIAKDKYNLLYYTGDARADALFHCALDFLPHFEISNFRKDYYRRHMFLARYGRQDISRIPEMDSRDVRRYVIALAEFLKEEAEASKQAMQTENSR